MLRHARDGADAGGGDVDDQVSGLRNRMRFVRKCSFAQIQLNV